jgi:ribosomal-protein-alanine N-acetyltransferase
VTRVRLRPVSVALARAVLDGDLSGVAAAPGWPHADTRDALRPYAEHGSDDVPGPWLVELADTGQVIGDCGWYGPPDAEGTVEIGYGLAPAYRGRGYGGEAVAALIAWVTAQPGVRTAVADAEAGNAASRAILARLGFAVVSTEGARVRYRLGAPDLSPRSR